MQSFLHSEIDYSLTPLNGEGFVSLYRDSWESKDLVVKQDNGQLMGHVLSFPILCLANYIIFKAVYEQMGVKPPNVLINGDDILFCATRTEYDHWWTVVRECGFFPSIGKNLFTPEFAQINSVLYRISVDYLDTKDPFSQYIRRIDEVKYVSFGLFLNRGKGKQGSDLKRTDIGAIIKKDTYDESKMSRLPVLSKIVSELLVTQIPSSRIRELFMRNNRELMSQLRSLTGFGWNDLQYSYTDKLLSMCSSFNGSFCREGSTFSSYMKFLSSTEDMPDFSRLRSLAAFWRISPLTICPEEDTSQQNNFSQF